MCGAPCGYLHITDFLEVLAAQRPRCPLCLLRQSEIGKMASFRISLLVGYAAYLFQDGEVMAHRVHRQAFHVHHIVLVIVDELFSKLPESDVLRLELPRDELAQCLSHVVIAGVRSFGTVYPDTRLQVLADAVGHPKQRHLRFNAALEQVLDLRRVKVPLALHQRVERRIDRKQQLVQFCVGFHRLAALAVQTAFPRVPQLRPARQLASELRHRAVHRYPSHYRGFARLVRSALFQVEQHLEFFYFHTLTVFVTKLTYE